MPDFSLLRRRPLRGKPKGLVSLVFLGMLTGLATSAVIVFFLFVLDTVAALMNHTSTEGFEQLSAPMRLLLPIAGSLLLIVLYRYTPTRVQTVGVAHVLDRLQRGRGRLSLGNVAFQFIGGLVALGSGHSVGKEGPAVHIGAGIASQLGQASHRAPSQLRLLTGCGAAAAISAAFNTPLAGVLFAMEVVLMEYSLLGFTPIIAASVTAAVSTRWFLGEHPAFFAENLTPGGLAEVPGLLVTGLLMGLLAAGFHRSVRTLLGRPLHSRSVKLLLAGVITGAIAVGVPQILGTGFDTINSILANQVAGSVLVWILIAKLTATSVAIGLGVPAGLIGPSLVIGACAGGLIGMLLPGVSDPAFYALLGMAAMMSAVLHAPLAALAAVLELSLNAHAMFPAMVVVLGANLICQHGFKFPSLFRSQLEAQGLSLETHPMRTALAQRFLSELASGQFDRLDLDSDLERVGKVAKGPFRWVVVHIGNVDRLVAKEQLNATYVDWVQIEADARPPLDRALGDSIAPSSRLATLDSDIPLLEAVKLLQREDTAGFLLPIDGGVQGLVTRGQLVSVLTSEGDVQ